MPPTPPTSTPDAPHAPALFRRPVWAVVVLLAVAAAACFLLRSGTPPAPVVPDIDTRIGTAPSDAADDSAFGTGGELRGNTIPCVTAPHGLTYWTPQTTLGAAKGETPYRWEAEEWLGFRASHWLDGGATQDYGAFYLLPGDRPLPLDHSLETARPDYYRFAGHELAGFGRSAILRLDCNRVAFGANTEHEDATVSFDPATGEIRAENPVHRLYCGLGELAGHSSFAVVRFNKKAVSSVTTDPFRLVIDFEDAPGPLLAKIGTSFTSADAAAANLDGEIPDWDFDAVRAASASVWEKRLSRIEIAGGDPDAARLFRTCLWRTSLGPRMVSDFGEPPDYDDFSLWDTFRALHPLLVLLEPRESADMMQALVRKYERGGWMPVFPMWGSYTSAMIGDHAASVLADAWAKGIRGFDAETAWEGVFKNAIETPPEDLYIDGCGRRALSNYMCLGYIPIEDPVEHAFHTREQSSRTLEYAYDDWCASVLARAFGSKADITYLLRRSGNWRNVFDPRTLWVQGRRAKGAFLTETNCFRRTSFVTEGTPCQYSFFVPHDVEGLVGFMGPDLFAERLDAMFSGNRYWHGNEPCHHIPWLYDFIGRPGQCQRTVASILRREYRPTPGGLCGNDDAGQLSAWYVFASLGFYPVCPGKPEYALGLPAFDRIVIRLENGRKFTISRPPSPPADAVLTNVFLGRTPLSRPFITHDDILQGRPLSFR